jgi:hypothetical protein
MKANIIDISVLFSVNITRTRKGKGNAVNGF